MPCQESRRAEIKRDGDENGDIAFENENAFVNKPASATPRNRLAMRRPW